MEGVCIYYMDSQLCCCSKKLPIFAYCLMYKHMDKMLELKNGQ